MLPIILGYIIWLLKEQKQKQINDAKARDERIQEEYKKRNANCDGTKALLKIGLYEYHDKYVELGYIPSYAYENFATCTKHIMRLVGMELARNCMKKLRLFI